MWGLWWFQNFLLHCVLFQGSVLRRNQWGVVLLLEGEFDMDQECNYLVVVPVLLDCVLSVGRGGGLQGIFVLASLYGVFGCVNGRIFLRGKVLCISLLHNAIGLRLLLLPPLQFPFSGGHRCLRRPVSS